MIKLLMFVVVYGFITSYGLYKIKSAEIIISFAFFFGFCMYFLGFLIWMYLLRIYPLSIIFPLCSGIALFLTQIASYCILHEPLTIQKIVACVLIVLATFLLSVESA